MRQRPMFSWLNLSCSTTQKTPDRVSSSLPPRRSLENLNLLGRLLHGYVFLLKKCIASSIFSLFGRLKPIQGWSVLPNRPRLPALEYLNMGRYWPGRAWSLFSSCPAWGIRLVRLRILRTPLPIVIPTGRSINSTPWMRPKFNPRTLLRFSL